MRFGTRVWSAGKLLVLLGALGATFLLFFSISMRVALRAQEVDVPALVGRTIPYATQALGDVGLGLRVDDKARPDEKILAGQIVQQDPLAGSPARRERTVRVWVSSGPRTTVVPAVTGQSERTAVIRLQQDGLQLVSVAEVRSPDYPADSVVSQEPRGAARAPRASLLVNRSEPATAYVMPDVVGLDGTTVINALHARGFRVTSGAAPASPGGAPGLVVRQRPAAGYPVTASEPIAIEVSR